jgi:YVTN family beta-propeller protein
MSHPLRLRILAWTITPLLVVNVLLLLLFVTILVSGSLNEEYRRYISERYLYAPSLVALFISPWAFARGVFGWLFRPSSSRRQEGRKIKSAASVSMETLLEHWKLIAAVTMIFSIMMLWIQNIVSRWRPSSIVAIFVVLPLLAWAQGLAVQNVCYPNPERDVMGGSYPTEGIALSVDERFLYLAGNEKSGNVAVFSAGPLNKIDPLYQQITTIPVGSSPQGFVRSPDGERLFVVNGGSATISAIDLRTHRLIESLPVGYDPRWIAISSTGDRVYVSNVHGRSISVIDAKQLRVIEEFTGVNCPEGLALSPDGTKLYVASQCGDGWDPLFIVDTSTKRIEVIPGLAVGNAVALSRDGKKTYVTRANFSWFDPATGKQGAPLSIVDTESNRIIKSFVLQISSTGLALTPDGRYLLVTNGYQLSVIDTRSDELVNSISIRGYGNAIAVRSDNLVIVAVSDQRRFVTFPLQKALTHWPCATL